MKLQDASTILKGLISKTDSKSEKKMYTRFIGILTYLENRDFDESQIRLIEEKLDSFQLNAKPENRKKYFGQKHTELITFLKEKFSLITEGYYAQIGITYGMIFGAGLGLTFGTVIDPGIGTSIGLALGTGIGMAIGIMMGTQKDAVAKKEGRVMNA